MKSFWESTGECPGWDSKKLQRSMNLLRTVMLMVYSSRHKGGFKKVMSEMNISLKGPEDALEFVRRVEKYPYTMDLCCGSIVVDAKSILGILYLGFDHVVHLKVHAGECGELRKDLEKFLAA